MLGANFWDPATSHSPAVAIDFLLREPRSGARDENLHSAFYQGGREMSEEVFLKIHSLQSGRERARAVEAFAAGWESRDRQTVLAYAEKFADLQLRSQFLTGVLADASGWDKEDRDALIAEIPYRWARQQLDKPKE